MSDASPNIPPPPQPVPPQEQPASDKSVPEPTGEGVVTEPYKQRNEL